MLSKMFTVFYISALLIQGIATQCLGNNLNAAAAANRVATTNYIAQANGLGIPNNGISANNIRMAETIHPGSAGINLADPNSFRSSRDKLSRFALDSFDVNSMSNGGGFSVSSSSPLVPTGISAVGDLNYEGTVDLRGNMPFLGTAVFDGILPATGVAGMLFGAGDERVGISGEKGGSGLDSAAAAAAANAGVGNGAGLANQIGYGAGLAGTGLTGPGVAGVRAAELSEGLAPYGINPAIAGGNALTRSLSGLALAARSPATCA